MHSGEAANLQTVCFCYSFCASSPRQLDEKDVSNKYIDRCQELLLAMCMLNRR